MAESWGEGGEGSVPAAWSRKLHHNIFYYYNIAIQYLSDKLLYNIIVDTH